METGQSQLMNEPMAKKYSDGWTVSRLFTRGWVNSECEMFSHGLKTRAGRTHNTRGMNVSVSTQRKRQAALFVGAVRAMLEPMLMS